MVGWQSGHAFACRKLAAASEFIGVRIPSPPVNYELPNLKCLPTKDDYL
jgi:hypothetical protein